MSAMPMNWPVVTATPLRVNVPAPGNVLTFTASRAFAGVLSGSLKPKSAAVKT